MKTFIINPTLQIVEFSCDVKYYLCYDTMYNYDTEFYTNKIEMYTKYAKFEIDQPEENDHDTRIIYRLMPVNYLNDRISGNGFYCQPIIEIKSDKDIKLNDLLTIFESLI